MIIINMINEIQSKSSVLTVVKVVLIVLFAAYIGIISAVVVHEAVGHGLVAMALGGEFRGIGVYWDGMGWADVDFAGLSPIRQAWVLAGGFLSTTLVAAILFFVSFRARKRSMLAIFVTPVAFAFLSDCAPYFFWDALFKGGIGDVSGILRIFPNQALRLAIVIVSAALLLAGIILFNALMYHHLRRIFGIGNHPKRQKIIIVSALFALQTMAWLSFDWSQIVTVAGINLWAHLTHITLTAIGLGGVVAYSERRKNRI